MKNTSLVPPEKTPVVRSRGQVIKYWIIITVFFALLILFLIEGAARVYIAAKYGQSGKSYGLWCYDKELGAIHCADAYNTNATTNDYGFRNTEDVMEPKPEGALRVIAYGGSTTFCYNLLNDETWPITLQGHLRQHHNPKDQVLNGGAISWSIGHEIVRVRRDLPKLKPDYVLIYSGINEDVNTKLLALEGKEMKALVEGKEYGVFAKKLDQAKWTKRNLALLRLMDYVVAPFFRKQLEAKNQEVASPAGPDPYILENYLHTLAGFLNLIKENGATPIFIVQAHGHNNQLNEYLTSYSRLGAQLAQEHGAIIVDMEEMVAAYDGEKMDLFYSSGVHYSKLGAEMMGSFLYEKIFADPAKQRENNISGLGNTIGPNLVGH